DGDRLLGSGVGLLAPHRQPIAAVVGEEVVPFLEAALVDEARFAIDEVREIGRRRRHARAHCAVLCGTSAAMNFVQARYWLRIRISSRPVPALSGSAPSPSR